MSWNPLGTINKIRSIQYDSLLTLSLCGTVNYGQRPRLLFKIYLKSFPLMGVIELNPIIISNWALLPLFSKLTLYN